MTETQKQPRKKPAPKARPDASADGQIKKPDASADGKIKKPDASADAQTKKPDTAKDKHDDRQLREAVLAAALPHAAFDGFTDSLLQKAGAEAGVAKTDLKRLFEDGPISLIEFYSGWADAEM